MIALYTQHKQLFFSALAGIIIIGLGVVSSDTFSFQKNAASERLIALTEDPTITTRDTDGDRLLDWEEQLYGTDQTKKDTDGDGTGDGEEARAGRNPLLPNTAKEGEVPTDETRVIGSASSTASIDAKRKEFLVAYLTKSGTDIRETTYRDLLKTFDAKQYVSRKVLTDLNIVSENTDDGLRTFLNKFGSIVLKYKTPDAPRSETEIFKEYSETQNVNLLSDLQLSVVEYTNFAKDLRMIPVPSGIAKTHLSIIEGYEGMALGLSGIQKIATDPINATGGYEGYTMYRVQVIDGFAKLVNEVGRRGLVFTEEEPGYMFYANMLASTE